MKRKKCVRCGKVKAVSKFYKNPKMTKGYHSYCISCSKDAVREWRKKQRVSKQPTFSPAISLMPTLVPR